MKKRKKIAFCSILILIVLIIVLYFSKNYSHYLQLQEIAFKIYPEISINIDNLDSILNNFEASNEIDFKEDYQFVFSNFDNYYNSFSKKNLDIMIANFYANLRNNSTRYNINSYLAIRSQGRDVMRKLNYNFACGDYFEEHPEERENYGGIASPSQVILDTHPICYWRYKFGND